MLVTLVTESKQKINIATVKCVTRVQGKQEYINKSMVRVSRKLLHVVQPSTENVEAGRTTGSGEAAPRSSKFKKFE